jgi:hypothetical protein
VPYPVEVVTPDLILSPDADYVPASPLDPCEFCGTRPHDAPEGIHSTHSAHKNGAKAGDAVWNHPHCWRCGYRPGSNVAVSEVQFRRMYDRLLNEVRNNQPSLNPPSTAEAESLKLQLEEAKKESAELRAQLGADE